MSSLHSSNRPSYPYLLTFGTDSQRLAEGHAVNGSRRRDDPYYVTYAGPHLLGHRSDLHPGQNRVTGLLFLLLVPVILNLGYLRFDRKKTV